PIDVMEYLGGTVTVNADGVLARLDADGMLFIPGRNEAYLNQTHVALPAPAMQQSGTLWVPLRSLAEHLLKARLAFRAGDLHLIPLNRSPVQLTLKSTSSKISGSDQVLPVESKPLVDAGPVPETDEEASPSVAPQPFEQGTEAQAAAVES